MFDHLNRIILLIMYIAFQLINCFPFERLDTFKKQLEIYNVMLGQVRIDVDLINFI